jgi:hypothetical protein
MTRRLTPMNKCNSDTMLGEDPQGDGGHLSRAVTRGHNRECGKVRLQRFKSKKLQVVDNLKLST